MSDETTPFESIRRTNAAGNEFGSSRDFARVLGYTDYRNFEAVIEKTRTACFNSGQRVEDHFVGITEMIGIGQGDRRGRADLLRRPNPPAGTQRSGSRRPTPTHDPGGIAGAQQSAR